MLEIIERSRLSVLPGCLDNHVAQSLNFRIFSFCKHHARQGRPEAAPDAAGCSYAVQADLDKGD
ncbi:hypothetical protein, partial [Pseudomonas aeruginosa]